MSEISAIRRLPTWPEIFLVRNAHLPAARFALFGVKEDRVDVRRTLSSRPPACPSRPRAGSARGPFPPRTACRSAGARFAVTSAGARRMAMSARSDMVPVTSARSAVPARVSHHRQEGQTSSHGAGQRSDRLRRHRSTLQPCGVQGAPVGRQFPGKDLPTPPAGCAHRR